MWEYRAGSDTPTGFWNAREHTYTTADMYTRLYTSRTGKTGSTCMGRCLRISCQPQNKAQQTIDTTNVAMNSTLVHGNIIVPACCKLYTMRTQAASIKMLPIKSILQNSRQGWRDLPKSRGQRTTRPNMQMKPAGILNTSQNQGSSVFTCDNLGVFLTSCRISTASCHRRWRRREEGRGRTKWRA